jgi:8-oxo-dGTP pyrophosphatase MutT (NUDIX family)/phosphohistidine phosphatase SixA
VSRRPARRPATPAAGGVVWRLRGADLEVAVAHRPRYDDWSLPKGKINPGEPPLLAAVREVGEEIGAEVRVGRHLKSVEYTMAGNLVKRVSYWAMRYLAGQHRANAEVDAVEWLTVAEASHRLSYPLDRAVLADFARIPATTATVLLIRHARAGKRSEFNGDDRLRPLDKIGRRHARDSVPFLATFEPHRIVAADRVRCVQTVTPLAGRLGVDVDSCADFSDEAFADDPQAAVKHLLELATGSDPVAICSQGKAIPGLLSTLGVAGSPYPCRKGSAWALSVLRGEVVAADYYPHPMA